MEVDDNDTASHSSRGNDATLVTAISGTDCLLPIGKEATLIIVSKKSHTIRGYICPRISMPGPAEWLGI